MTLSEQNRLQDGYSGIMTRTKNYIVTLLIVAATSFIASASSFSTMTLAEVGALLDAAPVEPTFSSTRPATDPVTVDGDSILPVDVNVRDLITKIYGLVDKGNSRDECIDAVRQLITLTPYDEEGDLWLDSADGYQLRYSGMTPQMSGMARFDDTDSIAEYCYFFVFPYDASNRKAIVNDQADFTGSILQEMKDMGMPLGANSLTNDLMEVQANYEGSDIDVRLLNEASTSLPDDALAGVDPRQGRYILMFIVQP